MVANGPFRILDLGDLSRLELAAFGHLVSGQPITPAAPVTLWQVCEWTLFRLKAAEAFKDRFAE